MNPFRHFVRLKALLFGSLRRQLMVGMVAIVASMMSLLIWDLTQRQRTLAEEQQMERASALARGLAVSSALLVAARDLAALDEVVQSLASYPDMSYALVLDSGGQLLAHNRDPDRVGQHLSDAAVMAETNALKNEANALDVASPVMLHGRLIGWVRLGLNGNLMEARLADITRSGLIFTLAGLGLSVILALLTSHFLTRRLSAIARVAHGVQGGRTELRVALGGHDEGAPLARQLNDMLDTLAQRDQALKDSAKYEQSRSHILELVSVDAPLQEVLEATVRGVEQFHPAMLCSILLLDDQGQHLGQVVAPSLPNFYNAAMEGIKIGPGVGSCGTAAFSGERVIVKDIATHPYWADFKGLAAQAGLASCWSQPIFSSTGRVLGTFAIYHRQVNTPTAQDIVVIENAARLAAIAIEKKQTQAALIDSENTFRTLYETAPHGVIYQDTSGRITSANPAAQRILGRTLDQLQGLTSMDSCWGAIDEDGSPMPGDQHPAMLALMFGQPVKDVLMGVQLPDGAYVWVSISATPLFKDGQMTQVYTIFEDVTERHRMQQQVRQLAFNDELTKLPNRRLMLDRLNQALTASKRSASYGALMFIDLDNFKPLNDRSGHDAGDLLLTEVARRLKSCVREVDTVSRFGGDEFVAMLVDLDVDPVQAHALAQNVAEKIRVSLAEPYVLACGQSADATTAIHHHCTASIGVTLFIHHDGTQDEFLHRADLAMYQAKEAGRNTVRFYSAH
ncbi:MAG TPA: diguanylate cyclase [Rhodoferax sp.]|nr:diguanylate cyclase [Rhodoferax sp.]